MSPDEKLRNHARGALERYFQSRSAPRVMLSLVMLLTGVVGWLISYGLLRAGLGQMWLRYPLSVLLGYGFFLALLRLWVELEMRRFDHRALEAKETDKYGPPLLDLPTPSSSTSWLDWLDLGTDFDADAEGCGFVILFGAVVAAVAACLAAVMSAPALVAEVFLDAFLIAGLYRRLRVAAREHWLSTAVRKTWGTTVIVAVSLAVAGGTLGVMAPGTHSIGPAIYYLRHGKAQPVELEKGR